MLAAGCASTETLLVETTPVESSRYSALVIDGRDGRMLYGTNATAPRFPASLTKMMTLYMVFEALDQGRLSKTTEIAVSAHAAGQPPSKIGLRTGQTIDVESAILALCVKSANDVAAALAEHLGGSEEAFAASMTGNAPVRKTSRVLGPRSWNEPSSPGLVKKLAVTYAAPQYAADTTPSTPVTYVPSASRPTIAWPCSVRWMLSIGYASKTSSSGNPMSSWRPPSS